MLKTENLSPSPEVRRAYLSLELAVFSNIAFLFHLTRLIAEFHPFFTSWKTGSN